jgi:hypothetical protein
VRQRAQILVIAAILLSIGLLFLAVAVDGGRLYLEHVRLDRAVQAAANAGISVAAEKVVALAAVRQTEAALAPPCPPPPPAECTPTPPPALVEAWLADADRAELVSDAVQGEVEGIALSYAELNTLEGASTVVEYPYEYHPQDTAVRVRVATRRELDILLVGLLDPDWVRLEAVAISQVPQR